MTPDLFVRQRLNQLTGLTKFTQKSGDPTPVPAGGAWTPLDLNGIDTPLSSHLIISAYSIVSDATDMVMRMVVDNEKIFPYPESIGIISGVDQFLHFNLQIPAGMSFSVEASSTTGGTANIDYLSVIEVDSYDHS